MVENPYMQFVLELIRALLIDELSGHVRKGLARLLPKRRERDCRSAVLNAHRRNRDRLLHRLRTEVKEEL